MDPLENEIETNRKTIRSDGYAMSLGEIVNMYRDREIIIKPEYQRLFRWSIVKQSRLIESILLGIPLPAIFVAQDEDGTWEVVDGLQRLSTILKFMGELRLEPTDTIQTPEPLVATRYLPSLEGATWDGPANSFENSTRISFKRARMDMRILLRESDRQVRYELFDRLNSGGAPTSPQEVRTALLLMENAEFYRWLEGLRGLEDFKSCIPISERLVEEQYDTELVIRFIALTQSQGYDLRAYPDIDTILTERSLQMARDENLSLDEIGADFRALFEVLGSVGPDAFRKYDERRGRSVGAFSVSAYEAITQGVYSHLLEWKRVEPGSREQKLRVCIRGLWLDSEFAARSGAGVRATQRIPHMGNVGARIFTP